MIRNGKTRGNLIKWERVKKNTILMCKAVPFTSLCQYAKYNNYNNLIYILFIDHHAHMNTDAGNHEY